MVYIKYNEAVMNSALFTVLLSLSSPEMECLSKNIYFESRNQSHLGQIAVAHVTFNRVMDPRYPDTVCEVVEQGRQNADGSMKRHQCQFSWYCDGLSDTPRNEEMWLQAQELANEAIEYYETGMDITDGATHYHTKDVYPNWAPTLHKVMRIDDHIFYRWD
jgi:N-acetylmuramoyl-L-alanine amidase